MQKIALLIAPLLLVSAASAQMHHMTTAPKSTAPKSTGKLPLTASGGTVVAVPPSIKDTSAFVTLKNSTAKAINLTGASASVAGQSMLMHTISNANMSGMVAADKLVVPARGTLTLKFNGDHIMLMGLKRALKVGEVLNITVQADDGRTFGFAATVKKP